ncbi:MAG: hypothetical protein IKK44_00210 [Clostridium sp.]|nr:hypothetical protein [Clostridium sp.]
MVIKYTFTIPDAHARREKQLELYRLCLQRLAEHREKQSAPSSFGPVG